MAQASTGMDSGQEAGSLPIVVLVHGGPGMDDSYFQPLKDALATSCEPVEPLVLMRPQYVPTKNVWLTVGFKQLMRSSGKLYHEVVLGTDFYDPQLGWVTEDFKEGPFDGCGVGDDEFSWAADGQRHRKWHKGEDAEALWPRDWRAGDVIGFAVDIEGGCMRFSINGEWVDSAEIMFDALGLSLFPALSMGGFFKIVVHNSAWSFAPPSLDYVAWGVTGVIERPVPAPFRYVSRVFHANSIDDMVEDLASLVLSQRLGVEQGFIFLLGHSFGGSVVLELMSVARAATNSKVAAARSRISGLVLVAWTYDCDFTSFVHSSLQGLQVKDSQGMVPTFKQIVMRLALLVQSTCCCKRGGTREAIVAEASALFPPHSLELGRQTLAAITYNETTRCCIHPYLMSHCLHSTLAGLQCPVLSVAGSLDRRLPLAYIERGVSMLPPQYARHVVIPDAGHFPFVEDPVKFNDLLFAFVQQATRLIKS